MIKANEMKKGMVIKIDDKACVVVDFQHVKLSKGGAVFQTKFKNIQDGGMINKRLRSDETLEPIFLDRQKYEYLYSAGGEHFFMHKENFEQITLSDDVFVEGTLYCKPNTDVEIQFLNGQPFSVVFPNTVDLLISETAPALKGATATNQYKKATLETGLVVNVPPFCASGELISVDTRTCEYIGRVKK